MNCVESLTQPAMVNRTFVTMSNSYSPPAFADPSVCGVPEIWVSLEDKQIEHATLSEDVLLQLPGPHGSQLISVFRQATLEKMGR